MNVAGRWLLIHALFGVGLLGVGGETNFLLHSRDDDVDASLTPRRAEEVHHDSSGTGKHANTQWRSRGHRATPRGEGWQLLAIDDTLVAERSPEVTRQCAVQFFYFY